MKATSLSFFTLSLLLIASKMSSAQSEKDPQLSSSGYEMMVSVKKYASGLKDLRRAFHDMTYTTLAKKETTYFQEWNKKIQKFPFDNFSQESKVDYILLTNTIKKDEYDLSQQQQLWEALRPALPFADKILRLVKMRHWGQTPDAREVATTYDSIGKEIERMQKQLPWLNLKAVHSLPAAMQAAKSLRENLLNVYKFYNGYDPLFTWWVTTSFKRTDSLMIVYIDSLRECIARNVANKDGSDIPGVPIGKQNVEKLLRFQMIPYSPEELIHIAGQEYAWCLKEIKKASAEMGYKDNWKDAVEAVKNDYVPAGRQPALIDSLQTEALEFIDKHALINIPELAKRTWTMKMMTPQEQLINPFFYGGILISISYPTNTMNYEDKLESMKGNNIYFARATVFHELLPGHYLQYFMNERYRTYRYPFHTAFWTEGWAFYWEMLMWDNGFDKTPEQKIGALYWRMTRCARIVFSLNFHLGKWTPGQCVQYLVDSADLEPTNARAEVRRSFSGDYDPLYQIAYMVGALQFRALHHELVDSHKMSNIEFHQRILEQNNIPVEMVRALLENPPLQKNYQPHWKFYSEIAP